MDVWDDIHFYFESNPAIFVAFLHKTVSSSRIQSMQKLIASIALLQKIHGNISKKIEFLLSCLYTN